MTHAATDLWDFYTNTNHFYFFSQDLSRILVFLNVTFNSICQRTATTHILALITFLMVLI